MNGGLQEKGLEKDVLPGWILRARVSFFNRGDVDVMRNVISKAFLEVMALF